MDNEVKKDFIRDLKKALVAASVVFSTSIVFIVCLKVLYVV